MSAKRPTFGARAIRSSMRSASASLLNDNHEKRGNHEDRDERADSDWIKDQPGGGQDDDAEDVSQAFRENDRGRVADRCAVASFQQDRFQDLAQLARRDRQAESTQEDHERVAARHVLHADHVEIIMPAHKAKQIICHGGCERERQEPPIEFRKRAEQARRVRIKGQRDEDDEREDDAKG